jgi:hypothetical protein
MCARTADRSLNPCPAIVVCSVRTAPCHARRYRPGRLASCPPHACEERCKTVPLGTVLTSLSWAPAWSTPADEPMHSNEHGRTPSPLRGPSGRGKARSPSPRSCGERVGVRGLAEFQLNRRNSGGLPCSVSLSSLLAVPAGTDNDGLIVARSAR